MKKSILCLLVCLNLTGLFAQTGSTIGSNYGRLLDSLNSSLSRFDSIFSGNALKILLGETDILGSRYLRLDIFSLSQLNNSNLRLLRNMIYARHGYRFNSTDLIAYFGSFDWYTPKFDNVDSLLTDIDKYHIQMIQAFEGRNENLPFIVPGSITGFWQDSPAVASGYSDRFIFHPDNRLEFHFSEMQMMPVISWLNGHYEIK